MTELRVQRQQEQLARIPLIPLQANLSTQEKYWECQLFSIHIRHYGSLVQANGTLCKPPWITEGWSDYRNRDYCTAFDESAQAPHNKSSLVSLSNSTSISNSTSTTIASGRILMTSATFSGWCLLSRIGYEQILQGFNFHVDVRLEE